MMTKKSLLLSIFQLFILSGFLLNLVACSSIDENGIEESELIMKEQEQETIPASSMITEANENEKVEALKGTCPRGRHCGSPHCSLWSDLDDNGACDRGE